MTDALTHSVALEYALKPIADALQPEAHPVTEAQALRFQLDEANAVILTLFNAFGDAGAIRTGTKGAEQRRQAQDAMFNYYYNRRRVLEASVPNTEHDLIGACRILTDLWFAGSDNETVGQQIGVILQLLKDGGSK